MRYRIAFMLMAAAAVATPATAQEAAGSPFGTWTIEQEVRYQDPPGSMNLASATVQAQLKLEQHGDSVAGVWTITIPGRPPTRVELHGRLTEGPLRLVSGPRAARLSGPDGDVEIETFEEYVLTVTGDEISGTIHYRSSDDSVEIPSRSIRGRRAS